MVGPASCGTMGSCAILGGPQLSAYPPDLVSTWCADHAWRYRQPAAGVRNWRVATAATAADGAATAFDRARCEAGAGGAAGDSARAYCHTTGAGHSERVPSGARG